MEMCFHGNRPSWGIKHPIISLWSKYHSSGFIRLSIMLAPVISSLDEIYCISILSYAVEVLHVTDRKQRSKMRVAYNSAFRKLFNYSWRESVTNLQHELGRSTWEELIGKRKHKFLSKIALFPIDSLTRIVSNWACLSLNHVGDLVHFDL